MSLSQSCESDLYHCTGQQPICISRELLCDRDYNCGSKNDNEETLENGCLYVAMTTSTMPMVVENTS